jgi:hypothetical protein
MLDSSRTRLLDAIGPDDVVVDVGGWADPFERADWVVDLMPYDTRGLYEREGWVQPRVRDRERFTAETWVQRDICDREPYPFADKSVDFAICSHTLEDVRDPVWVCRELQRIAKAGYVEVPSRLEEQSWGVDGPYVGWSHHRWLVDVTEGALEFVLKLHSIHSRAGQHFPRAFWEALTEAERVQTLWWTGELACSERVFLEQEPADAYLTTFVARELGRRPSTGPARSGSFGGSLRRRLGSLAGR